MGAIAEAISGAVSGITDIGKTIYDIFTNERDFDYQKSLQRDVFAREDNAVQRRMKDLEAAGLNPNLAAGSAAGAGAVVGRSNTPSLSGNPVGAALDAAQHVQQLRAQKTENEILKNQEEESENKAYQSYLESLQSSAEVAQLLGIKYFMRNDNNGLPHIYFKQGNLNQADIPLNQIFQYQLNSQKNAADMLQKDNEFYVSDKIADYIGAGARAYSGIGVGSFNLFGTKKRR